MKIRTDLKQFKGKAFFNLIIGVMLIFLSMFLKSIFLAVIGGIIGGMNIGYYFMHNLIRKNLEGK